eukprot:gnl/TRDRNA2_/TRDRNA2_154663_c0_seq1.p1 gnl/TRDRNA2_/TRDRNA2_154663_c0~~gnl/TRDRNA2_/TRDRNA2_154663_c0_seq1.p1  ORF type:complete len:105 (-),score=14.64 gnl/TRDRNA2_/TRDRNA2_154663_c0_seq1:156-470(-)
MDMNNTVMASGTFFLTNLFEMLRHEMEQSQTKHQLQPRYWHRLLQSSPFTNDVGPSTPNLTSSSNEKNMQKRTSMASATAMGCGTTGTGATGVISSALRVTGAL